MKLSLEAKEDIKAEEERQELVGVGLTIIHDVTLKGRHPSLLSSRHLTPQLRD